MTRPKPSPLPSEPDTVIIGAKSMEALWAEHFRDASTVRIKEPSGSGWLTMEEFCERANCGLTKAKRVISEAMRAGRMETFRGSKIAKDGKGAPQRWYRPKR